MLICFLLKFLFNALPLFCHNSAERTETETETEVDSKKKNRPNTNQTMPNHADTLIWNVQCSWNVCNNDNGHVIDVLIVWLVCTFGQFSSFSFDFIFFFYINGKEIWHAPIVPRMMTSKPVWRNNTSIICLVDIVYDFQLIQYIAATTVVVIVFVYNTNKWIGIEFNHTANKFDVTVETIDWCEGTTLINRIEFDTGSSSFDPKPNDSCLMNWATSALSTD